MKTQQYLLSVVVHQLVFKARPKHVHLVWSPIYQDEPSTKCKSELFNPSKQSQNTLPFHSPNSNARTQVNFKVNGGTVLLLPSFYGDFSQGDLSKYPLFLHSRKGMFIQTELLG